jgi:hypothetical protein
LALAARSDLKKGKSFDLTNYFAFL